jgi:uncharacterized membrane protein
MRKSTIAIIGLTLFSYLLSIYFYPQTPEIMATHWNAQGEVNGYMSKLWGLFFTPIVITLPTILFLAIPIIDPLKENIEKFRKYYDGFIIVLVLFMVLVHLQGLLWNTGTKISPNVLYPIGTGMLFYYVGFLMEKAERNWFIGIRTPWTLSSDTVWRKTNRLGGKLFRIAGIVSIFGVFFKEFAVYFIIIPALFVSGFTIIYSYTEYQKEMKIKKKYFS